LELQELKNWRWEWPGKEVGVAWERGGSGMGKRWEWPGKEVTVCRNFLPCTVAGNPDIIVCLML